MSIQPHGSRPTGIATRRRARAGILRHGYRRGERGTTLFIALILTTLGMVTALALSQIVVQARQSAEWAVHRSAAFAAATAGLEQSKLVAGHSTICTDPNHAPISFSGTLNNESYSVNVVYAGGMNVTITSTGTSGGVKCVLTRGCLLAPDSGKLRVINYVSFDQTKFTYDITSIPQRAPLSLSGQIELPNFDYWRNLAKAQGHYYTGDVTYQTPNLTPGVYFSEGGMTFKGGNGTGASVTMVCMGDFLMQNDTVLSAPSRKDAVIVSNGNVTISSGHTVIDGAIWAAGAFLIKNGAIAEGRVDAYSFTQSNGTLTDSGDPNVYQFLNGFSYNATAGGWLLTYSGWTETWN